MTKHREQLFMGDDLFVVNMNTVVGDENAGRGAVALGVDELVEAADNGQSGGAGLFGVFAGESGGEGGALNLTTVLAGSGEGVLQGELRRGRRLSEDG